MNAITGSPEQDTECLVLSLLPDSFETGVLPDSGARLVARKPNDPLYTPHKALKSI